MVKVIVLGVLLLGSPLWATEYDRPGGDVVIGQPGPPGPTGRDGSDASVPSLQAGLGTDIEFWRKGPFSSEVQYRRDFNRPSDAVFGVIGVRTGKDARDAKIASLEARLLRLETATSDAGKDSEPTRKIKIYGKSRD